MRPRVLKISTFKRTPDGYELEGKYDTPDWEFNPEGQMNVELDLTDAIDLTEE